MHSLVGEGLAHQLRKRLRIVPGIAVPVGVGPNIQQLREQGVAGALGLARRDLPGGVGAALAWPK
jgi:hypothetical protein